MSLRHDRKSFARPAMADRPVAVWFWNDDLDEARLRRQFDALMDGGYGGVVIQARPDMGDGVYLSGAWFDAVGAIVKRAKKRGASVWLHEELGAFGIPGTRGGHGEYSGARLVMDDFVVSEEHVTGGVLEDAVGAFMVGDSDASHGVQRRVGGVILIPDRIRAVQVIFDVDLRDWIGQRMLVFRTRRVGEMFNYLDAKAGRGFLREVHQGYYKRMRRSFGGTISHWFVNDAQLDPPPGELPWDPELDTLFRETRGYSLIPHLPALFFDVADCEGVRYDYWSLVGDMFREGFAAPLAVWCGEHKVHSSGHFGYVPTVKEAVRQVGAMMPLHERQDVPAVELPGNAHVVRRTNQESHAHAVAGIKQAASVRRQLGKAGVVSESFRGGGHGLRVDELCGVANVQFALGVTDVAHHGVYHSLRGDRKVDGGPVLGPQQPWWKFSEDYFERLARTRWLLTRGEAVREVLVLHPGGSVQAAYRHLRNESEAKADGYLLEANLPFETLDKHFAMISCALVDAQIDFDYGDEAIMGRLGSAEPRTLRVGEGAYRIVVLPPLLNLRRSTLDLLRDFAVEGGIIVAAGSAPRLLDGRPSAEPGAFINGHAERVIDGIDAGEYGPLIQRLSGLGGRTLSIAGKGGEDLRQFKVQRRRWEDRDVYFAVNASEDTLEAVVEIPVETACRVEEWDCVSGETRVVAEGTGGEAVAIDGVWHPMEARCFVAIPGAVSETRAVPRPEGAARRVHAEWRGRRTRPNILLLGECHLSEDGPPLTVAEARKVLFKRMRSEGGPVRVTSWWPFEVSAIIPWTEACQGVAEWPEERQAWLNGEEIFFTVMEEGMDPSMGVVHLPRLRLGRNVLKMTGVYRDPWAFEAPWVTGDFRVNHENGRRFVMEFDAGPVAAGPWPDRGMPFYEGSVVYRAELAGSDLRKGERAVLSAPGLRGAAEVRVDGAIAGRILWAPHTCDLTELWTAKTHIVEVEVANTLRNLFGPHYAANESRAAWFSREDFEAATPGAPRRFEACGLLEPPEIVIQNGGE